MHKYCWLFILFFLFSCHDKKPSLADNQPVDASDFFDAFQTIKLPYNVADTSLFRIGDTATISLAVLEQFIPDTALQAAQQKQLAAPVFHPAGKIESKSETYLLLAAKKGKQYFLSTYLFTKDKKKMSYLSHIDLAKSGDNDGYIHNLDINSEPTFIVTKSKTTGGEYVYSKNGFAYSKSTKAFVEVINESTETVKNAAEIINPIDTLPRSFKYSGDYTKDKSNFISVRDGNIAGRYTFFLHFEKSKGECNGELKGSLSMVNATQAVFQQSGDPCVIDFTFSANSIKVKERGSCGNHRDITCQFDDSYKKKISQPVKENKKKR